MPAAPLASHIKVGPGPGRGRGGALAILDACNASPAARREMATAARVGRLLLLLFHPSDESDSGVPPVMPSDTLWSLFVPLVFVMNVQ